MADENTTENTPEIGHNSAGSEQNLKDAAALAVGFARRVNDVDQEIKERQEDRRSIMGEAKTVGIKAKHVKLAQTLLKMEDEDVMIEDLQMHRALMLALNIDTGFQMELGLEDRRPLDERAKAQGYADGIAGKTLNNPYTSGSQKAQYDEGYHAAQSEAREAFQRRMEAANAEKAAKEAAKLAKKNSEVGGGDTPSEEEVAAQQGGVVTELATRRKKNEAITAAAMATKPQGGDLDISQEAALDAIAKDIANDALKSNNTK